MTINLSMTPVIESTNMQDFAGGTEKLLLYWFKDLEYFHHATSYIRY